MANKRQKSPEQLQFKRGGRGGTLRALPRTTDAPKAAPPAPRGLTEYAKGVWRDFWASPLVAAIDINADKPALVRWIKAISEKDAIEKEIAGGKDDEQGGRTAKGSTGQTVLNPLYRRLADLDAQIAKAEEQFGMTPLARMRLGIAIRDGGASIDGLKAKLLKRQQEQHDAPRAAEPLDLESLG